MISIRKRLLIWLLSALITAGSIACAAIYDKTLSGVNAMQDYALEQIAYSMQYSNKPVLSRDDDGDNEEDEESADVENFEFIGQIWDKKGELVLASNPGHALPRFGSQGMTTVTWRNRKWRIFDLSSGNETIQVGQPMAARTQMAAAVAAHALVPLAALIPALGLLIWIGVSYGLRPLKGISSEIEKRRADSMRPISLSHLPEEAETMVSSINALLKRLSESFEMQKHFIADAAHQLRTPLTALNLQMEIMSRSRDGAEIAEAFSNLRQGIARSTRLVEQLLTLARQQPEAGTGPMERIDMEGIARAAIVEVAPLAEARHIDLGLESAGKAFVQGNGEALTTLLVNLIDNAIRYIPERGKIDVRVAAAGGLILVEVEDDGPGIPGEEMERVFDRFYRGTENSATGSGLGLAIVKSIADAHHAKISLESSAKGLKVRLEFAPSD